MINGKDVSVNDRYFTVTGCLFEVADYKLTIDVIAKLKKKYWKDGKYNGEDVYFHLERYIYATQSHKKGIIILEERGWKEDNELLKQINLTINVYGARHIKPGELQAKIDGVFFSTKRKSLEDRTRTGLELTDLFSYPIHKFIRNKVKDKPFQIVEKKIDGFPNYMNKGLKIFPQPK